MHAVVMPRPVLLYHFTHLAHLPNIVGQGLNADSLVRRTGGLVHEAGDPGIKARRRQARVSSGPGGVVADYVPFYFAPRSPMLLRITSGGVPSFGGSARDLVYLCTTADELRRHSVALVASDRNATISYARFSDDEPRWAALIDWPLMESVMWNDTEEYPDR